MANSFRYPQLKIENTWRSIILLGSNTSCYKFALGKTILETDSSKTEILLSDIALPFAKNICEHLRKNDKQATNPTSNYLNFCRKYNLGEITEDELQDATLKEGFRYVIDLFHNVTKTEVPKFFEDNRKNSKSILLTDNFYKLLNEDIYNNLSKEVEARWNLWENSIFLGIDSRILDLDVDEHEEFLRIMKTPVTSARDSIIGYQEGRCFYCQKKLSLVRSHKDACEVDHFFPRSLFKKHKNEIFKKVNLVWNLVCACNECNGAAEKSNKLPDLKYLEKLNDRNNLYAETPHPLKQYIMNHTGKTRNKRVEFLRKILNEAAIETGTREGDYWKPSKIHEE